MKKFVNPTQYKKGTSGNWRGGISKVKYYGRESERKVRNATLELLGGKCVRCGFNDKRALQIDHVNGGGLKERNELGNSKQKLYQRVLKSILEEQNKYQLLCANCNWIKRVENNEVPCGGKKGLDKNNLIAL